MHYNEMSCTVFEPKFARPNTNWHVKTKDFINEMLYTRLRKQRRWKDDREPKYVEHAKFGRPNKFTTHVNDNNN